MLLLMAGKSGIMPRLGEDASLERVRPQYHDLHIAHIPEVGHLMHYEAPEAVAHHVLEFERALASRSGQ